MQKSHAALGHMMGPKWADALKETSLRGLVRTAAGLAHELATAESPFLMQQNELAMKYLNGLVKVCLANNGLAKDRDSKSYLKFLPALDYLAEAVKEVFGEAATLDIELQIIQANQCGIMR